MKTYTIDGKVEIQVRTLANDLSQAAHQFKQDHPNASNYFTIDDGEEEYQVSGFCEACDNPLLNDDYVIGEDACFCTKCANELRVAT